MVRPIAVVKLESIRCGRKASTDITDLEERLEEPITVNSLARLVPAFRCTGCGKKSVRVFDDQARLLFDCEKLTRCATCAAAIPLPRLEAMPQAKLCVACSSKGASPDPAPPYPQPPPDQMKCPVCGNPTVVRQNSQDMSFFLGCTSFPKCRWAAELT